MKSGLNGPAADTTIFTLIIFALLKIVIPYFMWQGSEWMHQISLSLLVFFSLLYIPSLLSPAREQNWFMMIALISNIAWYIFLTRPSVVLFFKGRPQTPEAAANA